jgi:hypothetical protein
MLPWCPLSIESPPEAVLRGDEALSYGESPVPG